MDKFGSDETLEWSRAWFTDYRLPDGGEKLAAVVLATYFDHYNEPPNLEYKEVDARQFHKAIVARGIHAAAAGILRELSYPHRSDMKPPLSDADLSLILIRWKASGMDFNAAYKSLFTVRIAEANAFNLDANGNSLLTRLTDQGHVDPLEFVDWNHLRERGQDASWNVTKWANAYHLNQRDPKQPEFWLSKWNPGKFMQRIAGSPRLWEGNWVQILRGLSLTLAAWLWKGRQTHFLAFHEAGDDVIAAIQCIFNEVDKRVGMQPMAVGDDARTVWLRYGWMAYPRFTKIPISPPPPEVCRRLRDSALAELRKRRPSLRVADAHKFQEESSIRTDLHHVLYNVAPLWNALKAHLRDFRELGVPGVARDLRYFDDDAVGDDPLPAPWSAIPSAFAGALQAYARIAEKTDPELRDLRSDFARYCLDCLRTKKPIRDLVSSSAVPVELVEPDAHWRLGYCRAVMQLGVNPEGKGHHVLFWLSQNDPLTKMAAAQAYATLTKNPILEGKSPRRAIMEAFWHLRRAHLESLNVSVLERRADRTRDREVHRTTTLELMEKKNLEIQT